MSRAGIFETIVGLIVIAVAAAFFAYAYNLRGGGFGGDRYPLDAVFGRIDGVAVGAEVRIAGVQIGEVAARTLNRQTYEADVQMLIDGNIRIPDDSVAKIVSDGLLGGAYVSIEPGASEEMLVAGDKIVITQGSVDLLGRAFEALSGLGDDGGNRQTGDEELTLDPGGQ
jgi:phospholipid/cholesterol/gamma-HCH transport system substrate-binding protein